MPDKEHIESELTYQVVGCAMEVLNVIGHGLREKTYERALIIEMREHNIAIDQQKNYQVHYKGQHIDDYIPDLIVGEKMILELKTVESICDEHIGQTLNYLRITGLEVGLVLNFKHSKLEWKKIILTKQHRG
jgi:GxxExxY protein